MKILFWKICLHKWQPRGVEPAPGGMALKKVCVKCEKITWEYYPGEIGKR